jgi:hypothetical protein
MADQRWEADRGGRCGEATRELRRLRVLGAGNGGATTSYNNYRDGTDDGDGEMGRSPRVGSCSRQYFVS